MCLLTISGILKNTSVVASVTFKMNFIGSRFSGIARYSASDGIPKILISIAKTEPGNLK